MRRERPTVTAVVLAGGASERFGGDKTRWRVAGRRLLDRAVDAVGEVADGVVVVGPWAPAGVHRIDEPGPRRGPAAALAVALDALDTDLALVVAGDHPLLQPGLLRLLVELADRSSSPAVVPERDGRLEPLVACYRGDLAGAAADLVDAGTLSLRGLLAAVGPEIVAESTWRGADPEGLSFLDVDDRADAAALEALVARLDAR